MVKAWLLFILFIGLPQSVYSATILVLGDSLSAGYGIPIDQGWVALLEQRLKKEHKDIQVVNASISGETTAGGRYRLPGLLKRHHPDIVIVELGGNDGLRGIAPKQMEQNLAAMIETARQGGAKVLLLGMKMPTNYGPQFAQLFESVYAKLAKRYGVRLIPFFLDGVAMDASLMQADGIHPNVKAQAQLLEAVWGPLSNMLN
ncbi:MAG: arylesterase [Methylothermaceae bacteria B42]|nr:MAG: arylesterase [Methylothermaceae bacteria B42]HHJ40356.1 arylesterase [Methylothermaceae bacterium]